MKKFFGIIAVAVLLTSGVMFVKAQDNTPVKKQATGQSFRGPNYVDKNNDGVCDNLGSTNKQRQNRNYVDKNNDGVCDNYGTNYRKGNGNGNGNKNGKCGKGRGKGRGNGNGNGNGNQKNK